MLSAIPNLITGLRFILVVPISICIYEGQDLLALVLFVIAGLSDALDGYLAKKFDWRTRVGALLDPVADKLLVAGTFIILTWLGLVPFWLAAIVVSRDIIIALGVFIYSFVYEPFHGEATKISKINTFLEILYVLMVLSYEAFYWPSSTVIIITGSAVFVTVFISGLDYIMSWIRRINSQRNIN